MRRGTRQSTRTALLLTLSVALLLWAKLKLVAAIPRTVYATPSAEGAVGTDGAGVTAPTGDADVHHLNAR